MNINTFEIYYGIKVFHQGEWMDAGGDRGRFRFKTELERDAKRKDLQNKKIPLVEQ